MLGGGSTRDLGSRSSDVELWKCWTGLGNPKLGNPGLGITGFRDLGFTV